MKETNSFLHTCVIWSATPAIQEVKVGEVKFKASMGSLLGPYLNIKKQLVKRFGV